MTNQWFDSFISETIPKKHFKPYNHSKRREKPRFYSLRNPDFCYFDDDDLELIEGYIGYKSIWQQYDQ